MLMLWLQQIAAMPDFALARGDVEWSSIVYVLRTARELGFIEAAQQPLHRL
jgi:hypothetical protein